MKKYAVELGEELGGRLSGITTARGLNLTNLVRFVMWEYLDRQALLEEQGQELKSKGKK